MNTLSRRASLAVAGPCLLGAATAAAPDDFNASMDAAMARMHAAMAQPGTGDPDHDFALMMIPHGLCPSGGGSRAYVGLDNAGAAIVNAIGPIRQLVDSSAGSERRFLVLAEGTAAAVGRAVHVQR